MFGCRVAHPSLAIFIPRHHPTGQTSPNLHFRRPLTSRASQRPQFSAFNTLQVHLRTRRRRRINRCRKFAAHLGADQAPLRLAHFLRRPSTFSILHLQPVQLSTPYTYRSFKIPIPQPSDLDFRSYILGNPMLPGVILLNSPSADTEAR